MNEFEKTLGVVMKEVLARPDKFRLERNYYNSQTLTLTVYKGSKNGIEITIKSNGHILVVLDEDHSSINNFKKEYREFSENNHDRKGLARAEYGFKERELFVSDYDIM